MGFSAPKIANGSRRSPLCDSQLKVLVVSQPLNDGAGNGEWLLTVNLHAELGQ